MDDQTRNELVELLGGMESRLGLRFTEMETRLTGMETRLESLKSYVDERLTEMETRLESTLKSYVTEQLAELETKLLSAFFSYQEHAEIKFRKMAADVSNVNASSELRLNNLEKRVIDIEKRLWMGGQPPAST